MIKSEDVHRVVDLELNNAEGNVEGVLVNAASSVPICQDLSNG
jgi:hypothetical protein